MRLARVRCGGSVWDMAIPRVIRNGLFLLMLVALMAGCGNQSPPPALAGYEGGCSHDQELPPLKLDPAHRAILASRSDPPRTAADYYFALPASYFSNVENSPERRTTFIDKSSLTGRYLRAEHWFECDGGGFEVTIRVFDTPDGHLIGISSSTYEPRTLYATEQRGPGVLESITLARPRFWSFRGGHWQRLDDAILPMLDAQRVIDRYRNYYRGHLNEPSQGKFISLDCELPAGGMTVKVTGRENFMDPFESYLWAQYEFNGSHFEEVPVD